MKINNKQTWLGVFFLISLDQTIKIVINNYYLDKSIPIFPQILYFQPMFNRDYSWVNSMLQLGISKWLHIVLVAIISLLVYKFYEYLRCQIGNNKMLNAMFAFIFSGSVCSLSDKVFWNGSLDYILVNGFFTFDLKDVYVNIFIGLLLLLLIFKSNLLQQIEDQNLINNFMKYLFHKS